MPYRKSKSWGIQKPPLGSIVDWSLPVNSLLLGAWIMNEGGGGTVYDITGFNNTITLSGTQTWVTGNQGSAVSFNGTTSYANALYGYSGYSRITVETWVKPSSGAGTYVTSITSGIANGLAGSFRLSDFSTDIAFRIQTNGSGANITATSTTAPNGKIWYHCVGVYDGTNILIYINGELQGTTSGGGFSLSTPSTVIGLGATKFSGGESAFLNGPMSLARVWGRALQPQEIQQLYFQPFTGIISPRTERFMQSPSSAILEPMWDVQFAAQMNYANQIISN
jgi:hypothetical protein